jgi:hypothetical protein
VLKRRQIFGKDYYVLWIILLAAFVTVGGREVWIGPSRRIVIHRSSFASTDAFFEAYFDAPNGSQRCLEIMRRFYGKGAIVFFCPPHTWRGDLSFGLISYLSWPQQIRKIEVERAQLEQRVRSLDRSSTSAVIFCDSPPPEGFTLGWALGDGLFIVPFPPPK